MVDASARQALAGTRFGDVRWVETTGSTNLDLLELARAGVAEGVVLVADHQAVGRGRLGRSWQAPPRSSLLMSVLLRPTLPPSRLHLVTMAVGVAACDACERVAGVRAVLKWPNDLLLEGRKLGGILAETVVSGGSTDAVVVGLGLNVNWPPDLPTELRDIAIALNHMTGREVDRTALLVSLLQELDRLYPARLGDELTGRYRQLSATIGAKVAVELPAERLEGRALDVTDEGHLAVELDGGEVRHVTAGDVVHLR